MDRLAFKQKKIESLASKHKQFENLLNKATSSLGIDDLAVNDLEESLPNLKGLFCSCLQLSYISYAYNLVKNLLSFYLLNTLSFY